MENRRSDLARGASSSQGSGEASAAGKGKKNRALSPCLVRLGREAAGTRTTRAWTGEKKTKIQGAPTSGDLGMIARGDAGMPEEIEGIDWDMDKLAKEIDCCLGRLNDGVPYDDDEPWAFDEQKLTALNQRLALCRIREHVDVRLDDASLAALYPLSKLQDNEYYERYEHNFEWYFDPEYCTLADLQDYQRLVIHNTGEYEDWEYYRRTCSTLEGDQQFVQFWENLSSKTKLLELYLTDSRESLRIERLLFYHALKIAEGLPHVFKTLIKTGFREFKWSVRFDDTWYKYYAGFFFDMWKLITKQKMNFKEALRRIHQEGKYSICFIGREADFGISAETQNTMELFYKPVLDRIGETAQDDDAYKLIMDSVKKIVMKHKTYCDYAKKKLDIAKRIGLIPPNPNKSST